MRKIFTQREQFGDFNNLLSELQNDQEQFLRYLRMSPERFSHLLSLVKAKIAKQNSRFRKSITAEELLAVTLRFLASGDSQVSLCYSFRNWKKYIEQNHC